MELQASRMIQGPGRRHGVKVRRVFLILSFFAGCIPDGLGIRCAGGVFDVALAALNGLFISGISGIAVGNRYASGKERRVGHEG